MVCFAVEHKEYIILSIGLPWWWLSSKESVCNAGSVQNMQVQSLGLEDPLE